MTVTHLMFLLWASAAMMVALDSPYNLLSSNNIESVPSSRPTNSVFVRSAMPSSPPTGSTTLILTSFMTPSPTPSDVTSFAPSFEGTDISTDSPTLHPTFSLSESPSMSPTNSPLPTIAPSEESPTSTMAPTAAFHTVAPTFDGIGNYTALPTEAPSLTPATVSPTAAPTAAPTSVVTADETAPSEQPSCVPASSPTNSPTHSLTASPTASPTANPTVTAPTSTPSGMPSSCPSSVPSRTPTAVPTVMPSSTPSNLPTSLPTSQPTSTPTLTPTVLPTPLGILGTDWWYLLVAQCTLVSSGGAFSEDHFELDEVVQRVFDFVLLDGMKETQKDATEVVTERVASRKHQQRRQQLQHEQQQQQQSQPHALRLGRAVAEADVTDDVRGETSFLGQPVKYLQTRLLHVDVEVEAVSSSSSVAAALSGPVEVHYSIRVWCPSRSLASRVAAAVRRAQVQPIIIVEPLHERGVFEVTDSIITELQVTTTTTAPPSVFYSIYSPVRIVFVIVGTLIIFGTGLLMIKGACYTYHNWSDVSRGVHLHLRGYSIASCISHCCRSCEYAYLEWRHYFFRNGYDLGRTSDEDDEEGLYHSSHSQHGSGTMVRGHGHGMGDIAFGAEDGIDIHYKRRKGDYLDSEEDDDGDDDNAGIRLMNVKSSSNISSGINSNDNNNSNHISDSGDDNGSSTDSYYGDKMETFPVHSPINNNSSNSSSVGRIGSDKKSPRHPSNTSGDNNEVEMMSLPSFAGSALHRNNSNYNNDHAGGGSINGGGSGSGGGGGGGGGGSGRSISIPAVVTPAKTAADAVRAGMPPSTPLLFAPIGGAPTHHWSASPEQASYSNIIDGSDGSSSSGHMSGQQQSQLTHSEDSDCVSV